MPIYEYRCGNGHNFEVIQSMSDDPVATCEVCDAPVERVFHPVAVHFKGSGFYTTDYASKGKSGGSGDGGEGSSKESKPSESKSSDSKPDSKSESKGSDGGKAKAGSSGSSSSSSSSSSD